MFSPTGAKHFHEVMKFARLYEGRSHRFTEAGPDADILEALRAAGDLVRQGKREEALAAYVAAADGKLVDYQKSVALEHATTMARALRKTDVVEALLARIPIAAVKKTVQMQILHDRNAPAELIAEFGKENLAAWPFWKAGEGYFLRGRAYALTKAGKEAEADLAQAVELTGDLRERDAVRNALADNRRRNLNDPVGALAVYRATLADAPALGSSDHFTALQGAAEILTARGEAPEAVALLGKVDLAKLGPTWRGSLRLTLGDALAAARKKDDAAAVYRLVGDDAELDPRTRKAAADRLAVGGSKPR